MNGTFKPITNWAPTVGRWQISPDELTYLGPQPEQPPHPFGICISNVRFSEGEARVTVRLPEGKNGVAASARLLLGYRSPDDEYIVIGLGGYNFAYTISQFDIHGWRAVARAGSESNLLPNHDYPFLCRVKGQRVILEVDGVRVLEHILDRPVPEGQLGLFAWGEGQTKFTDVSVRKDPGTVFVIMDFSEAYQVLYTDVIQNVVNNFHDHDLHAYHAGEVYRPGIILEDIVRGIVDSKIIIAEITPPNQNVFYELGYAHALKKPTILLAETGKTLPFDISGYRCLFYENSIGGKRKVEEGLRKHLEAILQE